MKKSNSIKLGNKTNSANYRINILIATMLTIISQLGIKNKPKVEVIGKLHLCYNQPVVQVCFGHKCRVIITSSEFDMFYLAFALFKVYLYESKQIFLMSDIQVTLCCLAYAVAFCECKGLNTYAKDCTIFLPPVIEDASLPPRIYNDVDESGIPLEIRIRAEEFKDRYKMM